MTLADTYWSREKARLQAKHLGWNIWCVLQINSTIWCARPADCDGPRQVITEDSPEELSAHLDRCEAEGRKVHV